MRKLIWLPLAGALLIGGAAVTAAAPDAIDDAGAAVSSIGQRVGGLLDEVLGELVSEGVITQDQSDTITERLEARHAEKREEMQARRAEMEARREEMRAVAQQLRGFLEDEVITADEVAQLPDGELKTALEALLADGDITVERLREMGGLFFRAGRGGLGGPGGHDGHGWPGGHDRPGRHGPPAGGPDTDTEPDS